MYVMSSAKHNLRNRNCCLQRANQTNRFQLVSEVELSRLDYFFHEASVYD